MTLRLFSLCGLFLGASHGIVSAGIACQSGCTLGAQDGLDDILPKVLRTAWTLRARLVILACNSPALTQGALHDMLQQLCWETDSHMTQGMLKLSNCWRSVKDRWWCVISPTWLGPVAFADLSCPSFIHSSGSCPALCGFCILLNWRA